MACYKPLTAYRSKYINDSGKRSLVFNQREAYQPDDPLEIPCRQCVGCRLERSRQWAVRCMHESQMHHYNCFITLTYNEEHLLADGSLVKKHFQDFMKRFRKKYHKTHKIRYYMCGEYGSENQRPHYHACIFGHDFFDKELWSVNNNIPLYRSKQLEELWPFGFSSIGDVTFESAAYVARYIMKKVTGDHAWHHYSDIDQDTGEITNTRQPEYNNMSLKPGIGSQWFEQYKQDVYPKDYVVIRGKKCKPPKYYDTLLEKDDAFMLDDVKAQRLEDALKHVENNTRERLDVREKIAQAKLKQLPRKL